MPTDDRLSVALEEIRERMLRRTTVPVQMGLVAAVESSGDVFPLLAAIEAVLKLHQPGRVAVIGAVCKKHEAYPHFSITSTEAERVRACQDCSATVSVTCSCGHADFDRCPHRRAITSALLPEETPDATVPEPAPAGLAAEVTADQAGPGGSMNPTPDCGGERKPPGATELWWCDAHREFHGTPPAEEDGNG